jgi:hypothetical protein
MPLQNPKMVYAVTGVVLYYAVDRLPLTYPCDLVGQVLLSVHDLKADGH